MPQKPSIPKGTRDFSHIEINKRVYIINLIKRYFQTFCFEPIETPSFENTSTLLGNYGEEGERLIFKILNSGDFLSKVNLKENKNHTEIAPLISEKALRYDLTIPFSRYVAAHQSDLTFPFKRYQIQPVWRADRPQKGRFREFYQCDADVVGTNSLWQEVEFLILYNEVFEALKLPIKIKINNRKILFGIVEILGIKTSFTEFTIALDKLDKIGEDGVIREMQKKGITDANTEKIQSLLAFKGNQKEKIVYIENLLKNSIIGMQGVEELKFVIEKSITLGVPKNQIEMDITLARGLHYYTGCIFEVSALHLNLGAIGGGGRYDNLTEVFGLKNMSGAGISFGLDRIYLALETLDLFPKNIEEYTRVLFLNFGKSEATEAYKHIKKIRDYGIQAELYPDQAKMSKQMSYANRKKYAAVVLLGSEEIKAQQALVKNMNTGAQETCPFEGLKNYLQNLLA